MLENLCYQDATPSIHFNFDNSNQKTIQQGNDDRSFVPYDYSYSKSKFELSEVKRNGNEEGDVQCKFVTPPSHIRVGSRIFVNTNSNRIVELLHNNDEEKLSKIKQYEGICVKLNTEEFFDDFENNFVINFDENPGKIEPVTQFRKTFESCPGGNKENMGSKIESYISEPMMRRASEVESIDQQNQEDIINFKSPVIQLGTQCQNTQDNKKNIQKENIQPRKKSSKMNCEIRKRIMFKNQEKIVSKLSKKQDRAQSTIINKQNLIIISSCREGWTEVPQHKKAFVEANSQPIKNTNKTLKKVENNMFSARPVFKDPLRSTTLDNWKKKFILHKHEMDLKQKAKTHNIFQKPFSIIR